MTLTPRRLLNNQVIMFIISISVLLTIWHGISLFYPPTFIPSPFFVSGIIAESIINGEAFYHLYASLTRIVIAFFISMAIGIAAGVIMGINRVLEGFLRTWVAVGLTIPGLAWALLSLLWFGIGEWSAIIATVLTVTPFIIVNMWEGVKSIDRDLIDMAKAFKIKKSQIFYDIFIFSLLPFIFASARYGFSIAWKIIVIAEMFGLGSGVGFMLNYWYNHFRIENLLAWIVLFSIVMVAIEVMVFSPINKYAFRWRREQVI